ncbi:MAG: DUF6268 family outer membrane beta-barrel protein [Bacteroidota bacterium]
MKYVFSISLLLVSFNALAQDFELFKIQSTYYPSQVVKESSTDGEVGFWEWSGQFAIPQLLKKERMILIHKFGYTNLRVDTDGIFTNPSAETTKHYHTVMYNLSVVKILNPNWRLLVNLSPTLASDFNESLNGSDFLFQASALALNAKSEKFKYGFGLAYTTRFGRQILIPSGVIKYNTQKMELDALLPNKLSLMFNTHKAVNFGLEAALDGGLFNNTSESQIVNDLIDKAGYSRVNVGPTVSVRLKETMRIYLVGGMAVGRRLEFVDTAGETLDRTPDNGPFIKVGFSISPKGNGTGGF